MPTSVWHVTRELLLTEELEMRTALVTTVALVFAASAHAAWEPVGDVDDQPTGNLANGTAGWNDSGWWTNDSGLKLSQIVEAPGGAEGNAMLVDSAGGGSIKLSNAITPISASATEATLYFKLYIPSTDPTGGNDDLHDSQIGVANAASSTWANGANIQIKQGQVKIGNTQIDQPIADDTWYEFWLQMNPSAGWWLGFVKGGPDGRAHAYQCRRNRRVQRGNGQRLCQCGCPHWQWLGLRQRFLL